MTLIGRLSEPVACVCLQLNSGTLKPHMDSNDCLVTAPLQMAAHTQLLLDATLMQADQLNTVGCTNYKVSAVAAHSVTGSCRHQQFVNSPDMLVSPGKTCYTLSLA